MVYFILALVIWKAGFLKSVRFLKMYCVPAELKLKYNYAQFNMYWYFISQKYWLYSPYTAVHSDRRKNHEEYFQNFVINLPTRRAILRVPRYSKILLYMGLPTSIELLRAPKPTESIRNGLKKFTHACRFARFFLFHQCKSSLGLDQIFLSLCVCVHTHRYR